MTYVDEVIQKVKEKYNYQPEFVQAVEEVLDTIRVIVDKNEDLYRKEAILERLVMPERIIEFRVPWIDDQGKARHNTGYRVQFNSSIGPYKGGLRFHPSVSQSVVKFLGFEQVLKNSLTGLPMGGGKGGSDFDPKGKSDREVMRFCQSFMTELYKYIGPNTDVPAGDIGVGAREIGYLFGQYKRIVGRYEGVLTGKGLSFGGSNARTEATGYGLMYLTQEILRINKLDLKGKLIGISGSGNVAIYAIEKAFELGAKVVTASDSNGFIYDEEGIDVECLKEIKFKNRGRIKEYLNYRPKAKYSEGRGIWKVKMDIAIPCATQNELLLEDAKNLVKNGAIAIIEGANMPTSLEANQYIRETDLIFVPGKAANAGGVATSGLEMTQNSERLSWSFEKVDKKLKEIMVDIANTISEMAIEYSDPKDYQTGANIAAFKKVSEAMIAQGLV